VVGAGRYALTRSRRLLVYGLIATIVGGHAFDVVADREHWPFSNYPMYSRLKRSSSLTAHLLYGVTDDAARSESAFMLTRYTTPFERGRLNTALGDLDSAADRDQRLTAALGDLLARYETRRRAGDHTGPPLRSLRLYRVTWALQPWAANVDQPTRRDLRFEYARPSA
jgi:hypothetical protein